jgi:hypothetical protein
MSFTRTPQQMRDGTKTVTRRHPDAWKNLHSDETVQPVLRTQGLQKGERHEFLCPPIEIISNGIQPLSAITADEVIREGFPGLGVSEFVDLLERSGAIASMSVMTPDGPRIIKMARRIEFRHTALEQS